MYPGDCLEVMGRLPDESVDLIYMDPPFNTDKDFMYGDVGFTDRFSQRAKVADKDCVYMFDPWVESAHSYNMAVYVDYMHSRMLECRRILKKTGSIYVHCDMNANAYLRILMDHVFGQEYFRNEIVWRIGWVSGYKAAANKWIRNHDTILYYTKGPCFTFNKMYTPYRQNPGSDYVPPEDGPGVPVEDTWNCKPEDTLDSIKIKSWDVERVGYPTQKPVALLKRIIAASSNPGDVVLDPFCGSGTTVVAAQELRRTAIGIDLNPKALAIAKERIAQLELPLA